MNLEKIIKNESFLANRNFKTLFHISDIHLRNQEDRFLEYKQQIIKTCLVIKNHEKYHKDESLIIVTGDIFHEGLHISAHAIQLLKIFVTNLTELADTIIIPGNHDDKKDVGTSTLDSLTAILSFSYHKNSKLHYLKSSGIYYFGTNLVFGHTSVIDKRLVTASEIKTETGRQKIALFHGMVDAKSKQDEFLLRGCDFSSQAFSGYDKVLLGDVHKVQKIDQDHIWYAGSLIQQSYGEDRYQHGGLLVWDLANNKPEFKQINNDYAFLTLKIEKGDIKGEATAPIGSLHLKQYITFKETSLPKYSSIQFNCDSTTTIKDIETLKTTLEKETTILHHKVNWQHTYQDKNKNNKTLELEEKQDVSKLLTQYLTENFPDELENLTELDKEYRLTTKDNHHLDNIGRWTLVKLEMENIFNYQGSHNLDFSKLPQDIISICGENGSGKSKLLEIILLAIYGTTPQYVSHVLTYGTKYGTTKITIQSNTDTYLISRSFSQTSKKKSDTKIDLYKNDQLVTATNKKQNETAIKQLFGTETELCDTHISKQGHHQVFIDKSPKEQLTLLKRIFGTTIYEDIGQKVKERLTDQKRELAYQEKELEKLEIGDMELLETEITSLSETLNTLDTSKTQLLVQQRDYDTYLTKTSFCEAKIKELALEIKKHRDKIVVTTDKNPTIDKKINNNHQLLEEVEKQLVSLQEEIETLCSQKHQINESLVTDIKIMKQGLVNKQKRLSENKEKQEKYTRKRETTNNALLLVKQIVTELKIQLDKLEAVTEKKWSYPNLKDFQRQLKKHPLEKLKTQATDLENIINTLKIPTDTCLEKDYQQYQTNTFRLQALETQLVQDGQRIKTLKTHLEIDVFKYDDTCSCCQHNSKINQIQEKQQEIIQLQSLVNEKTKEKTSLDDYFTSNAKLPEQYKNKQLYSEKQSHYLQLKVLIHQQELLTSEIQEFIKYGQLKEESQLVKEQRQQAETDIVSYQNKIEGYDNNLQKLVLEEEKLQKQIKRLEDDQVNYQTQLKNLEINQALMKKVAEKKQIVTDKQKTKNLTLSENKQLQAMHQQNLENNTRQQEITQLQEKITLETNQLTSWTTEIQRLSSVAEKLRDIERQIQAATHQTIVTQQRLEGVRKDKIQHRDISEQLEIDLYHYQLTKKYQILCQQFPIYQNNKCLQQLENDINGYLYNMTHFSITCDYTPDATGIIFMKQDKDKVIPINNCSGFEKFAIAIAIRLAIAKIHPFNSMNCLFIDEGFGVFDQQNLKKLPDMLETLKPLFRQIFIITHIEQLQMTLNYKIIINRDKDTGYPVITY